MLTAFNIIRPPQHNNVVILFDGSHVCRNVSPLRGYFQPKCLPISLKGLYFYNKLWLAFQAIQGFLQISPIWQGLLFKWQLLLCNEFEVDLSLFCKYQIILFGQEDLFCVTSNWFWTIHEHYYCRMQETESCFKAAIGKIALFLGVPSVEPTFSSSKTKKYRTAGPRACVVCFLSSSTTT